MLLRQVAGMTSRARELAQSRKARATVLHNRVRCPECQGCLCKQAYDLQPSRAGVSEIAAALLATAAPLPHGLHDEAAEHAKDAEAACLAQYWFSAQSPCFHRSGLVASSAHMPSCHWTRTEASALTSQVSELETVLAAAKGGAPDELSCVPANSPVSDDAPADGASNDQAAERECETQTAVEEAAQPRPTQPNPTRQPPADGSGSPLQDPQPTLVDIIETAWFAKPAPLQRQACCISSLFGSQSVKPVAVSSAVSIRV